jgi:hypothetical protein
MHSDESQSVSQQVCIHTVGCKIIDQVAQESMCCKFAWVKVTLGPLQLR